LVIGLAWTAGTGVDSVAAFAVAGVSVEPHPGAEEAAAVVTSRSPSAERFGSFIGFSLSGWKYFAFQSK
jgi:hypothetical protein